MIFISYILNVHFKMYEMYENVLLIGKLAELYTQYM